MLSEHLAILHRYPIGYLILALWTLYCMLRHTRVLVGIHGVRRPWSSFVSRLVISVMASRWLLPVLASALLRLLPSPSRSIILGPLSDILQGCFEPDHLRPPFAHPNFHPDTLGPPRTGRIDRVVFSQLITLLIMCVINVINEIESREIPKADLSRTTSKPHLLTQTFTQTPWDHQENRLFLRY